MQGPSGLQGAQEPSKAECKGWGQLMEGIARGKAFISPSAEPVNQKLWAIWKPPSIPNALGLYMFKQKPTPHPSRPPQLLLQETLSFLDSLQFVPCKVSPGGRASPRLRWPKTPEHPVVSLVWLTPAHGISPPEGGGVSAVDHRCTQILVPPLPAAALKPP